MARIRIAAHPKPPVRCPDCGTGIPQIQGQSPLRCWVCGWTRKPVKR